MLKNITKWVVNILSGIMLILIVLVVYSKCVTTFTKATYPSYFGYSIFEVASGSMEPTLSIHDVVVVRALDNENIQRDDIITYVRDNSIITHRVVFVDGDTITVKGDANNTIDQPINRSMVIGKVVKIMPELGIWKKILTEPKILVVIFVTLILFDIALSYKGKEDEKTTKNKDGNNKKKKEVKSEAPIKEVKIKEIPKEKPISNEKLLEFTRKIDISEINKLLSEEDFKLTSKEVSALKNKIESVDLPKLKKKEIEMPKLKEKEKKFLEYTMRLDLEEIQKRINETVK